MAKVKYTRKVKSPTAKMGGSKLSLSSRDVEANPIMLSRDIKANPSLSANLGGVETDPVLAQQLTASLGNVGTAPMVKAEGLSQQTEALEMRKEKMKAQGAPAMAAPKPKAVKVTKKKKAAGMQGIIDEMDEIGFEAFKAKYGKK